MLGGQNGLGFGVGCPGRCLDHFRGIDLDALLNMSTNDLVKLFTARACKRYLFFSSYMSSFIFLLIFFIIVLLILFLKFCRF